MAAIKDEFDAAFGPVRILRASEGDKEIGKPQPFDGINVDKLIRYFDRKPNVIREKRK